MQRDLAGRRRGFGENAVQVDAMDRQIGRAPAPLGALDRQPRQLGAVGAAQDAHRARRRGDFTRRRQRAEPRQRPRRVGRQLQTGAEFLQGGARSNTSTPKPWHCVPSAVHGRAWTKNRENNPMQSRMDPGSCYAASGAGVENPT